MLNSRCGPILSTFGRKIAKFVDVFTFSSIFQVSNVFDHVDFRLGLMFWQYFYRMMKKTFLNLLLHIIWQNRPKEKLDAIRWVSAIVFCGRKCAWSELFCKLFYPLVKFHSPPVWTEQSTPKKWQGNIEKRHGILAIILSFINWPASH